MSELDIVFTGHPFVDIGLATMAAFVDKGAPDELTKDDLDTIATYIKTNYVINPLKSFLTVVFPNSGFTNPAHEKVPENRAIYAENVVSAYAVETPEDAELDMFLGLPVPNVHYDIKGELRPGRAYRQHIPLLTGEGVINFFPNGDAGMPVSGLAMLAIQAFPMGCAKSAGRLLAVHSDSPEILWHFANAFLARNRQLVSNAQQEGSTKLPEPSRSTFTLLVETLLEANRMRREEWREERPFSVTAYHISNSGQGPSLDVYQLPMQVTGFLLAMRLSKNYGTWSRIVARAWQRRKGDKDLESVARYNSLYEDLFYLPERSARFIRTHLLRVPLTLTTQDDSAADSPTDKTHFAPWSITEEFLKRIMNMKPDAIQEIRDMGDRLAQYITEENDRRFLNAFLTARQYWALRVELLRANLARLRSGKEPLVRFDPFIRVFEEAEEVPFSYWGLARDLVAIRVIERLYDLGWATAHQEDLPESEQIATPEEDERKVS